MFNEAWSRYCAIMDDAFYEGEPESDGFRDGGVDENEETCEDEEEPDGIE